MEIADKLPAGLQEWEQLKVGLPLYMGEVPEYRVVDGQMEVRLGDFALSMPVNVFLCGCARGRAAIVQWENQRKDAEVIQFPNVERQSAH